MFMGPWDQGGPWSPTGIGGVHRFLNRVWTLAPRSARPRARRSRCRAAARRRGRGRASRAIRAAAHKTLRDVTADYEGFHFNTMVAKLMELTNTLFRYRGTVGRRRTGLGRGDRLLLLMLAPAAPHITEELWSRRLTAARQPWSSIHTATWPEVDASAVVEATREVPVQVNGKVRDRIIVPTDLAGAELEAAPWRPRRSPPCSTAGPRTGSSRPAAAAS